MGYLAAKSYKFLYYFFLQIYGSHFESAAKNSTCFQVAIGFIQFSISPEFLPCGIKQEVCIKSFQVNDTRENLPPHVENARSKPLT